MVAPKVILLVGQDENELGVYSFVISKNRPKRNHMYYVPVTAISVSEATAWLSDMRFDLLVCIGANLLTETVMRKASELVPEMPKLLLVGSRDGTTQIPDVALIPKGNNAVLMGYIAELTKSRRGPKVGFKKQVPVAI
jgi:hypothetical protein